MKIIERIALYLLLAGVGVIIWLQLRNKKDTNAQSSLLMAMAEKLKVDNIKEKETIIQEEQKNIPITEDDAETVRIAEKLYFEIPLTKKEHQYYSEFTTSIDAEYDFSKQFHPLVKKFTEGETNFTDEEKLFYEANKDLIDAEVAKKLQVPSSSVQESVQEIPSTITHQPLPIKGANPPLAPGERMKTILSLFEDGIPKNVSEIAELYSQKTGSKVNKGNISTIFGKLEGNQLLCQEIKHNSRWKVYYGLPEWFDGKKLKPEFKNKIV